MSADRIYKYASIFYKIAKLTYQQALNIFELPRDFDEKELKKLYKKKVFELHPDRNKSETAEEDFKLMQAAYELLEFQGPNADYDYPNEYDVTHDESAKNTWKPRVEPNIYETDHFPEDAGAEYEAEAAKYADLHALEMSLKFDQLCQSKFFRDNFSTFSKIKRGRPEPEKKPSWLDRFKKKPDPFDKEIKLVLEWSRDKNQYTRMIENFYGKPKEVYIRAIMFLQRLAFEAQKEVGIV